jgi:putative peptidoglycan lipid II flippase
MQKVISPLYYAREDTRSPFRFAVWAMLVNAGIALGLAPFIGFIAAALGTTVAGWVMLAQLWHGTRRMGDAAEPDARLRRAVPRIAAACAIMAVALVLGARALAPAFSDRLGQYPALALLVVLGFVSYTLAAFATGGLRFADIRAALRRSPAASG